MTNTPREQVNEYAADLADGDDVWCTWANKPARTADGFCQWCGSTKHEALDDDDGPTEDELDRMRQNARDARTWGL